MDSFSSENETVVYSELQAMEIEPLPLEMLDESTQFYEYSEFPPHEEVSDLMDTSNSPPLVEQGNHFLVDAATPTVPNRKTRQSYTFIKNPATRRRHRNRLLRKLKKTIDELAVRVGQQAVILTVSPNLSNTSIKTFGTHPLQEAVMSLKEIIVDELQCALRICDAATENKADQNAGLFDLPPLMVDGCPTTVEQMTQVQLRTFIPQMVKYVTGRGKPGWGNIALRPSWWPVNLPWANPKTDPRSDDEKRKVPWTQVLQKIVNECYKYYGREDLLGITKDNKSSASPTVADSANTSDAKPDNNKSVAELQTVNMPTEIVSITTNTINNSVSTVPDDPTTDILQEKITSEKLNQTECAIQTALQETSVNEIIVEVAVTSEGQLTVTSEDPDVVAIPVTPCMYQIIVSNNQNLQISNGEAVYVELPTQTNSNGEMVVVSPTTMAMNPVLIQTSSDTTRVVPLPINDTIIITDIKEGN